MAAQRDTNVWWFLDTLVVVHRTASGLGPLVLDITLPVGGAPPLHRHDGYDDSEYLLEGQLVVDDGGEWSTAEAGQWLSTRRGVPHRFRVVGDRPARMLGVHQRRSFLRLIYALGEPAQELSLPPLGRGPDGEEVLRTFRAHDVIVLGPSIEEDEALAFVATT